MVLPYDHRCLCLESVFLLGTVAPVASHLGGGGVGGFGRFDPSQIFFNKKTLSWSSLSESCLKSPFLRLPLCLKIVRLRENDLHDGGRGGRWLQTYMEQGKAYMVLPRLTFMSDAYMDVLFIMEAFFAASDMSSIQRLISFSPWKHFLQRL